MRFADRMGKLEMSGIRKMFDLATSETVNLGIGEPDFQPPVEVMECLHAATVEGHNKYGPSAGYPKLREHIAEVVGKKGGISTSGDNVLISSGATHSLYVIAQTFFQAGDEILTPDPGFVLYDTHARLAGAEPVNFPLRHENGFVPNVDELETLVTPRTKGIIINTPSNPTGAVLREKDVEDLVDFARKHSLILIADEVYDRMVYDAPHIGFTGKYEDAIEVNSFSKTYAMTGWRLGYLHAEKKEYVDMLVKMAYYTFACPPSPIQKAALDMVAQGVDPISGMLATFRERRDLIVRRINEVDGFDCIMPEGAFYAFPKFHYDITSDELAMELARMGVIAVPGTAFGARGEGHIRFSYVADLDQINKGMDILARIPEKFSSKRL